MQFGISDFFDRLKIFLLAIIDQGNLFESKSAPLISAKQGASLGVDSPASLALSYMVRGVR